MSSYSGELTRDQIKQFHEAFNVFDEYSDGQIAISQLGKALRSLGENPNAKELQQIIDDIDGEDGNVQHIEFPQFLGIMERRMKATDIDEEIREAFRTFDMTGRGYIDSSEMRFVLKWLQPEKRTKEINKMLKESNIDPNGRITFEQFRSLMLPDEQIAALTDEEIPGSPEGEGDGLENDGTNNTDAQKDDQYGMYAGNVKDGMYGGNAQDGMYGENAQDRMYGGLNQNDLYG